MLTFTLNFRSVGVIVVVLLGLALAYLVLRGLLKLFRRLFSPKLHDLDRRTIRARWEEIERNADQSGEMPLKIAVLEADKLLDHVLKSMAMPGTSLGERLRFAEYKHPRIRKIWWAHKLRNQIAHEASFYVDPGMAKRAVKEFRKALETLGVL